MANEEVYKITGGPGKSELELAFFDRFVRLSGSKEIHLERYIVFTVPGFPGSIPEHRDTISVNLTEVGMLDNSGAKYSFKGTCGGGGYYLVVGFYSTKSRKGQLTIHKQEFPTHIHC